jgi:hypothetical protein
VWGPFYNLCYSAPPFSHPLLDSENNRPEFLNKKFLIGEYRSYKNKLCSHVTKKCKLYGNKFCKDIDPLGN